MSAWQRAALVVVAAGYVVLWLGGVAQHWLAGGVRPAQSWLAALFLLLAGVIVLLSTRTTRDLLWLVCVALFGFAVEIIGVRFGVPFGAYNYTDILAPKLLGVPLVMAAAWMTLAAYVKQMLARFRLSTWTEALIAALWLTTIDLIIDPLAAQQLNYWRWAANGFYYGIPATNFAGWFATSLLAFLLFRQSCAANVWARLVGLSIVLFFTLLACAHGLRAAALVGCGLCALHLFVANLSRKRSGGRTTSR